METTHIVLGILILCFVAYYVNSRRREGWEPSKSFYNSGMPCDDFCAKIKNDGLCTRFNTKENTKCLNSHGTPVVASCYLHKNNNCMSMV